MTIKIVINGKEEELQSGINIFELLKKRNVRPEVVTVELNEEIIDRKHYQSILLKEGDVLEFVFFMGGGGWIQASPEISQRSYVRSPFANQPKKKWCAYTMILS